MLYRCVSCGRSLSKKEVLNYVVPDLDSYALCDRCIADEIREQKIYSPTLPKMKLR